MPFGTDPYCVRGSATLPGSPIGTRLILIVPACDVDASRAATRSKRSVDDFVLMVYPSRILNRLLIPQAGKRAFRSRSAGVVRRNHATGANRQAGQRSRPALISSMPPLWIANGPARRPGIEPSSVNVPSSTYRPLVQGLSPLRSGPGSLRTNSLGGSSPEAGMNAAWPLFHLAAHPITHSEATVASGSRRLRPAPTRSTMTARYRWGLRPRRIAHDALTPPIGFGR